MPPTNQDAQLKALIEAARNAPGNPQVQEAVFRQLTTLLNGDGNQAAEVMRQAGGQPPVGFGSRPPAPPPQQPGNGTARNQKVVMDAYRGGKLSLAQAQQEMLGLGMKSDEINYMLTGAGAVGMPGGPVMNPAGSGGFAPPMPPGGGEITFPYDGSRASATSKPERTEASGLGAPERLAAFNDFRPPPSSLDARMSAFEDYEGSAEGRRAMYEGQVNRGLPQFAAPAFRDFAEKQFAPIQTQYLLGGAAGSVPEGQKFSQFANTASGNLGQNDWQRLLGQVSGLLSGGGSGLSQQQTSALEQLQNDPNQQYQAALQAAQAGVAPAFRRGLNSYAGRAFNDFQTSTPEQQFLPEFVRRGYRF